MQLRPKIRSNIIQLHSDAAAASDPRKMRGLAGLDARDAPLGRPATHSRGSHQAAQPVGSLASDGGERRLLLLSARIEIAQIGDPAAVALEEVGVGLEQGLDPVPEAIGDHRCRLEGFAGDHL